MHYSDIPFDERGVFIMTANDASTIPGPLSDRMDVIEPPSHTCTEINIAGAIDTPRCRNNGSEARDLTVAYDQRHQ